jgi:Domain of unknown function (DUF5916)
MRLVPWLAVVLLAPGTAAAVQSADSADSPAASAPSLPPGVNFVRAADGRVTVRATRVTPALRIDGRLDEAVYRAVAPITDFIQQEPQEGEPATERTEIWILFDDENFYLSARCWDSHPEREVATEMRRDGNNVMQNENVGVILDTFYDRRNGLLFNTNSLGARRDTAVTDESQPNSDWNTVWDAQTATFDEGWTLEVVIPFKSLRYASGREQVWGINVRRTVRWKNEASFLAPIPAFMFGNGIFATSLAATLVGLEVPTGRNLEIKPYAISGLRTDVDARPAVSNQGSGDVGLDAKYGLTQGLTLDATYNTDFAQVEDDVQQSNLTRFSLQFPEKRDFFLEGQGIFVFGGVPVNARRTSDIPVMFFSRRIGLLNGRSVPIVGGARVTGQAGAYTLGAINIQSGEDEEADARPTNFTVLRLRRSVHGRSSMGAIYTRRLETMGGDGARETFGVDALYSPSRSLVVNAYAARTRTPGTRGRDGSYLAQVSYDADRYGLNLEHLVVESNFSPDVGFLRRSDIRREYALARFSPRPASARLSRIRRFVYEGGLEYVENSAGRVEAREWSGSFSVEMLNSDRATATVLDDYEFIPRPFEIAPGVTVPVGGYAYRAGEVSYQFGTQRRFSGTLSYRDGTLYGGTRRSVEFSGGRLDLSRRLSIEPTVSVNRVDLPGGDFVSNVTSMRVTFTMTPRMFVSALVQDNSSARALSANARFRWEYHPGSELFVVYSDGRDTTSSGFPQLVNRAFVVKITRLVRF